MEANLKSLTITPAEKSQANLKSLTITPASKSQVKWKTKRLLTERGHYDESEVEIPLSTKGAALPSETFRKEMLKPGNQESLKNNVLSHIKLYTDTPKSFHQEFLTTFVNVSTSSNKQFFPTMCQNKDITFGKCINKTPENIQSKFLSTNFASLGWSSQEEYQSFLNTSMLFAFSGSAHYCKAYPVTKYLGVSKVGKDINDIFQMIPQDQILSNPPINILSIAAFECRGIRLNHELINKILEENTVHFYSKKIMDTILYSAKDNKNTDIVLIPFGMGMFLADYKKNDMKNQMMDGWAESLNEYSGDPIKLHCCLMPGQYETLSNKCNNTKITFQNHIGKDAYMITQYLQDEDKGSNPVMINAGDHDWLVLLDNKRRQDYLRATLLQPTSDENLGVRTSLSLSSLQNIYNTYKSFSGCIISLKDNELRKIANSGALQQSQAPAI